MKNDAVFNLLPEEELLGVKNVLLEERKAQAAGFAMDWTGLESAVRPRAGAMLLRMRRMYDVG